MNASFLPTIQIIKKNTNYPINPSINFAKHFRISFKNMKSRTESEVILCSNVTYNLPVAMTASDAAITFCPAKLNDLKFDSF